MWRVRGNRNICTEKVLKQRVHSPFHTRTWDNLIQVQSVYPGAVSVAVVRHVLLHVVHQVKRHQSGYVLVFCLLIRFPWKHGGVEKSYQPPERNGMHPTCTRPVGSLFCRHQAGWTVSPVLCVVTVSIWRRWGGLLPYLLPHQQRLLFLAPHEAQHLLCHALLPASARLRVVEERTDSLDRHTKCSHT